MVLSEARVSLQPLAVDAEAGPPPPAWARGRQPASRFWYFANSYGEPWVARRDGDALRVAGAELGWRELRIAAEQAEGCLVQVLQALPAGQLTLEGDLRFRREELYWLASVITAAFEPQPPAGREPAQGRPPNPWSGWARRVAEVHWP